MKKILQILKYLGIILLLVCMYFAGYVYSGLQYAAPHFHANFSMYIDGKRVDFSLDKYSQDIAGCKIGDTLYAKDRVHLHENNPDTIHIHHDGVTWGDFFKNNNMLFNESTLIMDDGEIYVNNEKNKLIFILNGEVTKNPFNMLINSKDRLLINFGEESEDTLILGKFQDVSNNAAEYNAKYDPGTCSGTSKDGKISLIKDLFHSLMGH